VSYHCSERSGPNIDKIDDVKDNFNEKLERVFGKFPKYYMENFL
jgi:hypothetical protein